MKGFVLLLLFAVYPIAFSLAQPFTRVDTEAGLNHISDSNGVAVADYDQDGYEDIFFVGFHSFNAQADSTWNRLLRNKGDGTFEDVTTAAGFTNQFVNTIAQASLGEKMGASWGDYDNDGFPDLFLSNSREDQLYHNNGDGTFTDVTAQAGVAGCHQCYSSGGLWFDHDRDGDLDLYVSILNGPNIFYENRGDGTFRDRTSVTGLAGTGITWTTAAVDIGKDGFLDLYLANDTQPNECFANTSGQHYNETSLAYRLADEGAGMGLAVGDYNNDGFFDLYVTNIFNHHPNPLYRNLGNRKFADVAAQLGVDNTGWGWGVHFFDYDHDGDEDLFAVNGVVSKQYILGSEQVDEPHFLFRNTLIENGGEGFTHLTESSLSRMERARGMEVFDYDLDGDLDVLIANVEAAPFLFRNDLINTGDQNWFQVRLEGSASNRSAFGTEVRIKAGGQTLYRWHHGTGFFAQSLKPVHFGIGAATTIAEIQVTWLSGEVQTFTNLFANQVVRIKEGDAVTAVAENPAVVEDWRVTVFPNPFATETNFTFVAPVGGSLEFSVFNALGERVHQHRQRVTAQQPVSFRWAATHLPRGLYYYTARIGNQTTTGRLVRH